MKGTTQVYHLMNDTYLNPQRNGFINEALQLEYLDITAFGKIERIQKAFNDARYQKVASVQTTNLDRAFQLTNHIDRSWTENEGVGVYATKVRSTSVGDLMQDEDGKWWAVAMCGFKEIEID